jgi:hypothetical protein
MKARSPFVLAESLYGEAVNFFVVVTPPAYKLLYSMSQAIHWR